jgi:hypothetical protein
MNFETDLNRLEGMRGDLVLCLSQLDRQTLIDLCVRCGRDRVVRASWDNRDRILRPIKKFRVAKLAPPDTPEEQEDMALFLLSATYILRVGLAYLEAATELQEASHGRGKERSLHLAGIAFQAHIHQPTL